MATREHDNDQPASPWSRTSVQLSALFLRMLLVVGIAIAIFHHGSSAKNPAGQCPRGGTEPRTAGHDNDARLRALGRARFRRETNRFRPRASAGCDLAGRRHDERAAIVQRLGPQHVENGINVCFAHNPSGALLAAMNLIAEGTTQISRAAEYSISSRSMCPPAVTTEPAIKDGAAWRADRRLQVRQLCADARRVRRRSSRPTGRLSVSTRRRCVDRRRLEVRLPTGGTDLQVSLKDRTLSRPMCLEPVLMLVSGFRPLVVGGVAHERGTCRSCLRAAVGVRKRVGCVIGHPLGCAKALSAVWWAVWRRMRLRRLLRR